MQMKPQVMSSVPLYLVSVAMLVILLTEAPVSQAVTCNPLELSPCLPAITSPAKPSDVCCGKLREQVPCLCGYIRNPAYRGYVTSPGAKRVADACGVTIPTC